MSTSNCVVSFDSFTKISTRTRGDGFLRTRGAPSARPRAALFRETVAREAVTERMPTRPNANQRGTPVTHGDPARRPSAQPQTRRSERPSSNEQSALPPSHSDSHHAPCLAARPCAATTGGAAKKGGAGPPTERWPPPTPPTIIRLCLEPVGLACCFQARFAASLGCMGA